MAAKKKPTAQAMKNAEIAHLLALVFGHNELAKKAESLGEKVYHRLASENYVKALHKLGHAFVVHQGEDAILEIKQGRATVNLYPRDIEVDTPQELGTFLRIQRMYKDCSRMRKRRVRAMKTTVPAQQCDRCGHKEKPKEERWSPSALLRITETRLVEWELCSACAKEVNDFCQSKPAVTYSTRSMDATSRALDETKKDLEAEKSKVVRLTEQLQKVVSNEALRATDLLLWETVQIAAETVGAGVVKGANSMASIESTCREVQQRLGAHVAMKNEFTRLLDPQGRRTPGMSDAKNKALSWGWIVQLVTETIEKKDGFERALMQVGAIACKAISPPL